MRGGYYRPMVYHRMLAGLDQQGNLVGWQHTIVGKSVLLGSPFEAMVMNGAIDERRRRGECLRDPELHAEVHNGKEGARRVLRGGPSATAIRRRRWKFSSTNSLTRPIRSAANAASTSEGCAARGRAPPWLPRRPAGADDAEREGAAAR